MAIPTLVLGVGGTGVRVLRHLKKLHEGLREDERVPARFLAIDFDRSALMFTSDHELADLEDDEFLYLQPEGIQDLLRNLDRKLGDKAAWSNILDWYPDRSTVQVPASEVEANGAGQFRLLGRAGFFLNDEQIDNAVRSALENLRPEVDSARLSKQKRVILVSSLAGGTGAGMLIDLAYLARRQSSRPRVFAYLALPDVFHEVDHGGRIYQNGYAALRELAHFKDQQIGFEANYYRINPVNISPGGEEPFARLYLFGRVQAPDRSGQLVCSGRQMAETILAQLHRKIQEKTLSIASNTVSSNSAEERVRRRTHCFSTAGSGFISLNSAEVSLEQVLHEVMTAVTNDDKLQDLQQRQIAQALGEAYERLSIDGVDAENGAQEHQARVVVSASSQKEASETDARALRRLVRVWRERITADAVAGCDRVMEDLAGRLTERRQILAARDLNEESMEEVEAEIERLKALVLTESTIESYPEKLKALKKLGSFSQVDQLLRNLVQTLLLTSSESQGVDDQLLRRGMYRFLRSNIQHFYVSFPEDQSPEMAKLLEEFEKAERREKELAGQSWLRKLTNSGRRDKIHFLTLKAVILRQALDDQTLRDHIRTILQVRANKTLEELLDEELEKLDKEVEKLQRPFQGLLVFRALYRGDRPLNKLPESVRNQLQELVREKLPTIVRELNRGEMSNEDEDTRRRALERVVKETIIDDPDFRKYRYVISDESGGIDDREEIERHILSKLVNARQEVFVRRTPNPQRKGFGVLLVPRGVLWPRGGAEGLRSFIEANAEQILDCRCEIIEHEGSRIWLYYEDLFNPPEHLRHLDDYYLQYERQEHHELFHIDKRLLANENFGQIISTTGTFVVHCGNHGCRENIGLLSRDERICPGCGGWIRSRCGNECSENQLHLHDRAHAESCPRCGGFNHAAWWRCDRHGKGEVLVSVEKERCPDCIRRHLDDPLAWPESTISVRPDLATSRACPRCEDLAAEGEHAVFTVPRDLLPFFQDGVNGHDRARYLELARRYKLAEGFRCPSCRTSLIPVHHRSWRSPRNEVNR